jgi:hypothetical protein
MLDNLGRTLIWLGGGILVVGLLLVLISKIPGLGHLPGDILIQRDKFTVFVPLGTMILLSVVLTIVLNLIARIKR